MDKTIILKLKEYSKALTSLEEATAKNKTDITRDAVIKRFEYCFELAWKTAKIYLSEEHGAEAFSPKSSFRELRRNKIISAKETEIFLTMTDDRNEIIHSYDEDFSNKIYKNIKTDYLKLLQKLKAKLNAKSTS